MSGNEYIEILGDSISKGEIPPYLYCYPPRSSYRELKSPLTWDEIWEEDKKNSLTDELNLYIHVPFCRYKCGYCNLYTVVSRDQDLYDAYIDAVVKQLFRYEKVLQSRTLRTVYFGGGTPTLLSRQNFLSLFTALSTIYPNWRNSSYEVCLEATPDSIADDPDFLNFLIDNGVTRVNMGVQSLDSSELKQAGRGNANVETIVKAFEIVNKSPLPNLSVDLINGFAGQTDELWKSSVDALISFAPQTISTYFLTVRPDALFAQTGAYSYHRDPALYNRYDYARKTILSAGYIPETNIRYKQQGRGGYIQKCLQFHGVPYLGIGAGARTYTNTVDYLLNTDTQPSLDKVKKYISDIDNGIETVSVGFEYNDEERIRKRLVLDLFDLDLQQLEPYNWESHKDLFTPILDAAEHHGLLQRVGATRLQLTPKGYKYRDNLSWLFCSPKVVDADHEFYQGLHASCVEKSKAKDN
ncbi:coproporphyrinogen-III oxidase family protein, partial [Desulfovibrio inopinatus]|uniref:coproporphyrinogen-III oxidase family protein n=1 Tax=Desulfovibrio inopinatus TaxID=102109 RepID=UPI0003F9F562